MAKCHNVVQKNFLTQMSYKKMLRAYIYCHIHKSNFAALYGSTITALSILLNYSQNEIVYAWVYSGWCRGPNLKLVILRNSVNFKANTRFASVILVLQLKSISFVSTAI